MATTLVDLLKGTQDEWLAMPVKNLLRQLPIFNWIPFVDVNALRVNTTRWLTLPATGTRKYGGSYISAEGVTEEVSETLSIYGGDLTVDRVSKYVTNRQVDHLTEQINMKTTSMAATWRNSFVNGDHAVDEDQFEGLKKRVANSPARMTVDPNTGSTAEHDVYASAATLHATIDALHEAVHKVSGSSWPDQEVKGVILGNEASVLGLSSALRRLGLNDTTRDNFERTYDTFRGFAILEAGLKSDQSTEIILNTEDPGDGGTDSTSLYVVKLGEDDGLHGIQLQGNSPEAYDPVERGEGGASGPQLMRRIDWPIGLRCFGSYSIARITSLSWSA